MNEPSAFYSQMARDTVSVLRPFHASVALGDDEGFLHFILGLVLDS